MIIEEYVKPTSLAEAYKILCDRPNNRIIGGGIGLNCARSHLHTAIDVSSLSLNYIQIGEEDIQIGSLVTFHMLETDEILPEILREAFFHTNYYAGGIQLKNHITVGGAVVSKFSKSNFLTLLFALDAKTVFYHNGEISLSDYLQGKMEKDILIAIKIPGDITKIVIDAITYSKKDYPVLNAAAVKRKNSLFLAIGARTSYPIRLLGLEHDLEIAATAEERELLISEELNKLDLFGSDIRAGAAYRREIAVPLLLRVMEAYHEG